MTLIPELKRRARHVVGPLIGSLLVAYFAYHAVEGDRGIRAWQRLDGEVAEARAVRDRLSGEQTLSRSVFPCCDLMALTPIFWKSVRVWCWVSCPRTG